MKIILKIALTIFNVLSIIVLFISAVLLVLTSFNFTKQYSLLNILSGSMMPRIKVGSIVLVTKTSPEQLKVGDVINYSLSGNPISITHRLVEIRQTLEGKEFITKGDANKAPDPAILKSENIIGKVILILPYLGYLVVWARQPIGFVALIIVPSIIIILSEILNIKKVIEKDITQKLEAKYQSIQKIITLFIPFSVLLFSLSAEDTAAYFSDSKVMPLSLHSSGDICKHSKDWIDLSFNKKTHKLKIIFKHCFPKNHHWHYKIHYFAHGQMQEIYSNLPDIDDDFQAEQFLGTCTTEICNPDYDLLKPIEISVESDDGESFEQSIDLK